MLSIIKGWGTRGKHLVKKIFGEQLIGVFDFVISPIRKGSFGTCFNGQVYRKTLFHDLQNNVAFDSIVETGTLRGATSSYMHRVTGLPINTVELSPRFYRFAKIRTLFHPGISVSLGDSREFLYSLANNVDALSHNTLFYLDAHWNDDLPLWEEIDSIVDHWSFATILIDDFKVPDDPGYRYDDYGHGRSLTLENLLLKCTCVSKLSIFFPNIDSSLETGGKRGCVVLVKNLDLANSIREIPHLDEWSQNCVT